LYEELINYLIAVRKNAKKFYGSTHFKKAAEMDDSQGSASANIYDDNIIYPRGFNNCITTQEEQGISLLLSDLEWH
jgi:hypothetical protein